MALHTVRVSTKADHGLASPADETELAVRAAEDELGRALKILRGRKTRPINGRVDTLNAPTGANLKAAITRVSAARARLEEAQAARHRKHTGDDRLAQARAWRS